VILLQDHPTRIDAVETVDRLMAKLACITVDSSNVACGLTFRIRITPHRLVKLCWRPIVLLKPRGMKDLMGSTMLKSWCSSCRAMPVPYHVNVRCGWSIVLALRQISG
jgi:hypothetical protein